MGSHLVHPGAELEASPCQHRHGREAVSGRARRRSGASGESPQETGCGVTSSPDLWGLSFPRGSQEGVTRRGAVSWQVGQAPETVSGGFLSYLLTWDCPEDLGTGHHCKELTHTAWPAQRVWPAAPRAPSLVWGTLGTLRTRDSWSGVSSDLIELLDMDLNLTLAPAWSGGL